MLRVLVTLIISVFVHSAHAQSFSCPIGKQPACLSYSDNVCDSLFGKCIKRDAQCFDALTCYPGGFVCKDELDKAVSEYESLISKHNNLVDQANSYRRCILNASTIDEAQSCRF